MNPIVRLFFATTLAGSMVFGAVSAGESALGSPEVQPSPEHPVGWRGDGSGRYPGATPPIAWERKKNGATYETKGILWMTPLPDTGVSCPIIVGSRIYITTEISDLVCIDKASGRVLWIRSNPEFEGYSEADRKSNPMFAAHLEPVIPQLVAASDEMVKANAELVEALNAQMPDAPTAAFSISKAALKKRAIEKKILDQQIAVEKAILEAQKAADVKKPEKVFERYWGQAVFGFSGPTPVSDGKHVCAFFTTGVSVCYDLDGNRKWIHRAKGSGSEHGNFASPILCGNVFVVWANEMRGYDVESGALLWSNPAKAFNTYGSLFKLQSGNDLVAAFQWGFFTRVRDGKVIWDQGVFGDSVQTPIVENNTIFARVGYPKNNKETIGFRAFKIPESTDSGKLTAAYQFNTDWSEDELVVDKQKNPFDRGYVASPLFVDGLIYQITQGAGLMVHDAATGNLVYKKVLPLKPRTQYWNWAGASTSPTLAGMNIYLMDNQGTTLVIAPGKEFKEIARNVIEESKDGKSQVQNLATPIFEGARMYYRTPGYLYCIGEKK